MPPRPCIECGALTTNGARCDTHRLNKERQRNQRREGDKTWARRRLRRKVNQAGGAHCGNCWGWFTSGAIEIDHRVPLANGGTDTEANVWPLCGPCHDEKSAAEHRARMAAQRL
jgi:5-methylcytosine-specific restriction protein A